MRPPVRYTHLAREAKPGQVLPLFTLTLTLFIGAALLGIDIAHVRAETERMQHAANAAALAGVIYLPGYQGTAKTHAYNIATSNGFTSNLASGVQVQAAVPPNVNYWLTVKITEPIPLFFGGVFNLGKQTVTREATAAFVQPLQMGSPDYVQGIPMFPSALTSPASSQGYLLNQGGPYSYKEDGDRYSPFFESFHTSAGASYAQSGITIGDSNPCGDPLCKMGAGHTGPDAVVNQAPRHSEFHGYNYVVAVPAGASVLVKLFDPFSEDNYNVLAHCADMNHPVDQALPGCVQGPVGAKNAPQDQFPDQAGVCTLGQDPNPDPNAASLNPYNCRSEYVDAPTSNAQFQSAETQKWLPATGLQFSLHGPFLSLGDSNLTSNANDASTIILTTNVNTADGCATDCVIGASTAGYFTAGNDPATQQCTKSYIDLGNTCKSSDVAFRLVNYAVLHNTTSGATAATEYYKLNVQSDLQTTTPIDNIPVEGQGLNAYGVAACALPTPYDKDILGTSGGGDWSYVTAPALDPSNGWNSNGCPNPNLDSGHNSGLAATCSDNASLLPDPNTCVHVFALDKLPLVNYLNGTSATIPLGFIPAGYAQHTLQVQFFDPGDVLCPDGSLPPCTGGVPVDTAQVLTPGGTSLDYWYTAAPDYNAALTGYNSSGGGSPGAPISGASPLDMSNRKFNGSNISEYIVIPPDYSTMTAASGSYWKVHYQFSDPAQDATTWELSVSGDPVHLVDPNSAH